VPTSLSSVSIYDLDTQQNGRFVVANLKDQSVGAIAWGRRYTEDILFASTEPHDDGTYHGAHGFVKLGDIEKGWTTKFTPLNMHDAGDALCIHPEGRTQYPSDSSLRVDRWSQVMLRFAEIVQMSIGYDSLTFGLASRILQPLQCNWSEPSSRIIGLKSTIRASAPTAICSSFLARIM
jgi:hypothetical protein